MEPVFSVSPDSWRNSQPNHAHAREVGACDARCREQHLDHRGHHGGAAFVQAHQSSKSGQRSWSSSSAKAMFRSPTTRAIASGRFAVWTQTRSAIVAMSGKAMGKVIQSFGWTRCRFIIASTALGATLLSTEAVTAMRGAIRTGRVRAAVIIQSAASSALSPGSPS